MQHSTGSQRPDDEDKNIGVRMVSCCWGRWLGSLLAWYIIKTELIYLPVRFNHAKMKQSRQSHSNESNARVPVASGSGESGRERVGDGVPTAKLLLLLLRALPGHKKKTKTSQKDSHRRNTISHHVSFMSTINSRVRENTANHWTRA